MGASGAVEISAKILVLFDGVCNLCNSTVKFIIKRDPSFHVKFASLQSEFGRSQLIKFGLKPDFVDSMVVIENGRVFQRSDGVIKICSYLQGGWQIFRWLKIIPRSIRDGLYDILASHRYKLFGKNDSCMIPSASSRARFVD